MAKALTSLEDFITDKFTALKLEIPSDDVEYIARLIEEEELEEMDKKEGVKGMVEGYMTEDMIKQESNDDQEVSGIDQAIDQVLEHWQDLRAAQLAESAAAAEAAGSSSSSDSDSETDQPGELTKGQKSRKALLDSLSAEELAAAQKRALLAQYGYVEEEGYEAGDSGMGGTTLRRREEDKEAAERRALIDRAIREEGRRKRKSKRAKQSVDLMAPNLNKAKVQVKAQMARDSAKIEANSKKERDRAALEKQRYVSLQNDMSDWPLTMAFGMGLPSADQARAKLEKQKKAQKGERRA